MGIGHENTLHTGSGCVPLSNFPDTRYRLVGPPQPVSTCTHVNAFSFLWTESYGYAFPPFSLIGRVLENIRQDEATVLMVVPIWTTQPWFLLLLQMTIDTPVISPRKLCLLSLMNSDKIHPLTQKLQLMACRVSGKHSLIKDFQRTLPVSLWHHGTKKKNATFIQRWMCFRSERQINFINPSINMVLEFLNIYFEKERTYSAINTAR